MIKRMVNIFLTAMFIFAVIPWACAFEKGPLLNSITKITKEKIVKWAKDPIIVNALKEANIKAFRSSDEIAQLDKKWVQTQKVDEWTGSFINNPCADYLRTLQYKESGKMTMYPEIFVMDRQGCIVAETNRTSDFWQGDEDKFIDSFAGGKGAIFIAEPAFDESSRKYVVQVSVPVLDPDNGNAIGAMTVSIDVDALGENILR